MGKEIDLMANYPKAKRNLEQRAAEKTDEERNIARQFGKDFLTEIVGMGTEAIHIILGFGNLSYLPSKSTMT